MKLSSKLLATILGLGLLYAFFRLFNGTGGSGLGDFIDALGYASLILFFTSLVVLTFNARHLKKHFDTFFFLLLGFPMTLMVTKGIIENINLNRAPDLIAKYPRPVNDEQYIGDSIHIKIAIDSLIALRNRQTQGTKVLYAFIDTIIYSQKGDQIFVSYVKKYEPNNLGNDLDPWFLSGKERNTKYWDLTEGKANVYTMSGSFHDMTSLKKEVRKFYFNQYYFADKDSLKENYFWK